MEYEIDKWDLEGSEQLFEPLNRKNKKDLRMVNEYCDEHEFLYGTHTCKPIWERGTGNLKMYEVVVHHNKKDKIKFVKNRKKR